jgi:hypothetical protein
MLPIIPAAQSAMPIFDIITWLYWWGANMGDEGLKSEMEATTSINCRVERREAQNLTIGATGITLLARSVHDDIGRPSTDEVLDGVPSSRNGRVTESLEQFLPDRVGNTGAKDIFPAGVESRQVQL